MTNPSIAMLIPTLLYLGVDVMLMGGHFTKFFVGCTRGIEVVGYVMMGSSVSSCISSFLIGRLMKCVSRFALFIVGGATYLLVLVFMLVWDPDQGRLWHLVLMAVAVGFARASIATISSTLLGMLFVCQQEAAFGNLCFWQSLGAAAILALGIPQSMCAYHVISIVICILVFALGMYCLLELRLKRERTPGEKKPEKKAEGKEMTTEMLAIAEPTNNEISID
ncbi:protein unc-93 homolog A-like [Patiria miniata]|uniref:Uncharacterized protein n=1 Tax=Patiria miniata TaxID=46514 RepID=A0A914AA66_PATMI|nr:protein unc-93 homolog A-like [Patiria miniata]